MCICLTGACDCRWWKYAVSLWSIGLIADSILDMPSMTRSRRNIRRLPSVNGRLF